MKCNNNTFNRYAEVEMNAIGKQPLQPAWNSFIYLFREINKTLHFFSLSVKFEVLEAVNMKIRTIPHNYFMV